jgi:hypothetical protein
MKTYKIKTSIMIGSPLWSDWSSTSQDTFFNFMQTTFPFIISAYYKNSQANPHNEGEFVFVVEDEDEDKLTWLRLLI